MRAKRLNEIVDSNDGFGAFFEEIKNGNVLLMIGCEFEANKQVFEDTFYDYLLKKLNGIAGTDDCSFSDLSHDNRFLLDVENHYQTRNIHQEIIRVVNENEYSADEDVSSGLLRLIGTGLFRFVFTTSFSPLVEIAMEKQFGKVRVMNIYDKSSRDIVDSGDLNVPTVYYLFGKAMRPQKNELAKKFVATDNDALEVLRKWQIEMSNSILLKNVSDKYILTLGCAQADWLFRFIWYTMKGDCKKLSKGVVSGCNQSDSLSHYLKLNRILIDNDADALVNRIVESVEVANSTRWNQPQTNCDVFISYSRGDAEVAELLYNTLTSKGLRVWYDKFNLGGKHGGPFLDILKQSIDTSMFFIAILSNTIAEQAKEVHVYRREWEWAKELKYGLTADCRCFATFASDYNINDRKYEDALGWLADIDNFEYCVEKPNFDEWAEVIYQKIVEIRTNGKRK